MDREESKSEVLGHECKAPAQQPEAEPDFSGYYARCHDQINRTGYHRGLSMDTLDRFNIGFDENWKHPKAVAEGKNPPATPRLIIPTSVSSYLARDTREPVPEAQKKYAKSKVGNVHIFNLEALDNVNLPCFVVEGEIDALSIIDVGGNALALGSTSKVGALLQELEGRELHQPLIVALDDDEAGNEAARRLAEGLEKLGIPFYRRNPCEGFKDANEALRENRGALRAAVESARTAREEEKEEYLRTSSGAHLQSFIDGIAASMDTPCISSGFKKLDSMLDGGFYEGLYIAGGISSVGKTTWGLQICDQIAASGHDVLIFSLEMARSELMAKSISRHTFSLARQRYGASCKTGDMAKTVWGITDGKRWQWYSQEERELINEAIKTYGEYADRIFIHEGAGDIGIRQIRELVAKHIRLTGQKPFVLVDYLQIAAPYSDRSTDKQNTDKAVLELKRMSRDFKIPVMAVSSFNRENYGGPVHIACFEESGAIEYSADCLIGLQLKDAGTEGFDARKAKQKDPRLVEVVLLKNRNGRTDDGPTLAYHPRFGFFEDADGKL